jgi:hypothetical protein
MNCFVLNAFMSPKILVWRFVRVKFVQPAYSELGCRLTGALLMKATILGMVLLFAAPLATAVDSPFVENSQAFVTGNDLYRWCTARAGSFLEGSCYGFIQGASDLANGLAIVNVCLPHGVTVQEVADVVKKYLTDHPAERHYIAFTTVIAALSAAFPCPKAPPAAAR